MCIRDRTSSTDAGVAPVRPPAQGPPPVCRYRRDDCPDRHRRGATCPLDGGRHDPRGRRLPPARHRAAGWPPHHAQSRRSGPGVSSPPGRTAGVLVGGGQGDRPTAAGMGVLRALRRIVGHRPGRVVLPGDRAAPSRIGKLVGGYRVPSRPPVRSSRNRQLSGAPPALGGPVPNVGRRPPRRDTLLFVSWTIAVDAGGLMRSRETVLQQVTLLIFPSADIILLAMLLAVIVRGTRKLRDPLLVIVVSIFLLFLGDSASIYVGLSSSYQTGNVVDVFWFASFLLLAVAAVIPVPELPDIVRSEGQEPRWIESVSYTH